MKKKKINFKKYNDMHKEVTLVGDDGTEVIVRSHIPFSDKIAMATEMVERCLMIHEDSCCYEIHTAIVLRIYMAVKYYTNLNVDGAEAEDVADFMVNNGLWSQFQEATEDDFFKVVDIYYSLLSDVMRTFEDDRSIAKAVRTSFGFLFNGEDITESMAKAEMTKDTLYNALGALREKEEQEASRVKDGKLKLEGKLLNFAKKE